MSRGLLASSVIRFFAGAFSRLLFVWGFGAIARRVAGTVLSRLSFVPYLAGADVSGFTRRLLSELGVKHQRGELSHRYLTGWVNALLAQAWAAPRRRRITRRRLGHEPPAFAILSPSMACNLRCSHCYANASSAASHHLDYEQLSEVVRGLEAGGTSLIVLSGGEPFAFSDHHQGVLDLVTGFPHLLFVIYTNGTLVDERVVERLSALGNVLPLLSVEGLAQKTNRVRGPAVFEAVEATMARLRSAGVLFGVSATASKANFEELGSQPFLDRIFARDHSSFLWVLELVAQGRAGEQLLLSNPERERLQARLNAEVDDGKLIVSFLHAPTARSGCVGAERFDGFFYLDWEGDVRRCVYQPEVVASAPRHPGSPSATQALIDECSGLMPCPWASALTGSPSRAEVG